MYFFFPFLLIRKITSLMCMELPQSLWSTVMPKPTYLNVSAHSQVPLQIPLNRKHQEKPKKIDLRNLYVSHLWKLWVFIFFFLIFLYDVTYNLTSVLHHLFLSATFCLILSSLSFSCISLLFYLLLFGPACSLCFDHCTLESLLDVCLCTM